MAALDTADGYVLHARERKRVGTWHSIKDAGIRLFMEHGSDAVSIDDIAGAAAVSRTTFFNYFGSKYALIQDCEPGERDSWRHLLERPENESLWDSLVALLLGFAEFLAGGAGRGRAANSKPSCSSTSHWSQVRRPTAGGHRPSRSAVSSPTRWVVSIGSVAA